MRTEILAITVLALTAAVVVYNMPRANVSSELFQAYKVQFGKTYESAEEEQLRMKIFQDNMEIARQHNADPKKTFTMGATQFSDLTAEEFGARFHGFKPELQGEKDVHIFSTVDLPSSVDWSAKGAVTPVKNQGDCGSCWSFSTTGSCEGANQIKNGNLLSFSEQQLMDCSWLFGNQGCNGGLMDNAFRYLVSKGNMLESDYPYTAQSSFVCKYKKSSVKFTPTGYKDVQTNSVDQLMAAVADQPISIAVQANQAAWQQYTGGIVTSNCGQQLDHGVLNVGYGTSGSTDFWKVKNSWGASWGEQGYIRIERSNANLCGVLSSPSYPTA